MTSGRCNLNVSSASLQINAVCEHVRSTSKRDGNKSTFSQYVRGERKKSGLLCSNPYNSSTRRPTLTCYIPNQWKFNKDFTELYRLEIAALIEEDNLA